ncbi:hypothetical protein UFOVP1155_22 [uncultured Caudovirales phage]|uniref:Uncharacterized protein n=1 Tax=uncultured Caudovirales phage TaxID=2100421 RepID=A0A6J5R1N6_9CAUD|nr:hypothetical protein UFOVP1155_22 [uncultured Caudovirales phage]
MQKYMSHPKHGKMPVYSIQDIERNKLNGWIVDGEEVVKPTIEKPITIHLPKKRGRPARG